MRNCMRIAAGISVATLALAPRLEARTVELAVDVATEIVREDGASRVLLKVSDLSALQGQVVRRAMLEIPLPDRAVDRDLNLYLYAVDRAWDPATVAWNTPWQRPGGDWRVDGQGVAGIRAGETRAALRFDVAGILREIAEDGQINAGFVLLPGHGSVGDSFLGNERLLLSMLSQAKLSVSFRRLPAKLLR
ncbi:MAG: hypothetical protein DHS20C21_06480 [Gemmatimonadota bacterium]|nr:MAG: hypothetical protein DHS20C21_06480 [Gemmatimonadota bacterium]